MKADTAISKIDMLLMHAEMLFEADPLTGAKPRTVSLIIEKEDVGALKAAVAALKKTK